MVRAQKKNAKPRKQTKKNTECKLPILDDARNRYKIENSKKESQNKKDVVKINLQIPSINPDDVYYHAASRRVSLKNELQLPHVPSGLDLRRTSDISVGSNESYDSVFSFGCPHSSEDKIDSSDYNTQSRKRRVSHLPVQRPPLAEPVTVTEDKKQDKPPLTDTLLEDEIQVTKPEPQLHEMLTLNEALLRKTKTGDGSMKGRFKRLAKMVKTNLMWVKDLTDKPQEVGETFVVRTDKEAITFDLYNFRVNTKSYGGISVRAKRILAKNALERTEDDLLHLRNIIDRLKCFDKYSKKIKHELARVVEYESFEEGRVILKQGHIGLGFYFILKGSVSVIVSEVDKATGQKTSTPIAVLEEGHTFGELALMHDIKRAATIKCLTDCEFLRVDKPDFDIVLRVGQSFDWQRRLSALKAISIFKKLSTEDLDSCNNISRLIEFTNDTVIMGGQRGSNDYIYFVNSGKCKVVRVMTLVREHQQYGDSRIRLASPKYLDLLSKEHVGEVWRELPGKYVNKTPERHLMVVAELKQGNYFGVGEDLAETYILAKGRVECLMVPRLIFAKLGKSRLVEAMKNSLSELLPKNVDIFEKYRRGQRWREYKECITKEIVKRRNIPNATNYADVPESILQDNE